MSDDLLPFLDTERLTAELGPERASRLLIAIRRLEAENRSLQDELAENVDCGGIVGRSEAIRRVLQQVDQVAATEASVLIEGETGTGKELVARTIHQRSRRHERPMVKVNCGAISAGLVESELFGHEKGAFTGASERRIGRFELADGGTLFLDEVGELPLDTQVKLLRALQEQEFERVGSSRAIQVDIRWIAATNRNLEAEVQAGRFRADLFYRLNVFPIHVPPLRERAEDIAVIGHCALPHIARNIGKDSLTLTDSAVERLTVHPWPGNVRELLNVLERAAILSPDGRIDEHNPALPSPRPHPQEPAELSTLDEVDRRHIRRVLEHTEGQIDGAAGAAKILGIHPNTLRSRMIKLGVSRP